MQKSKTVGTGSECAMGKKESKLSVCVFTCMCILPKLSLLSEDLSGSQFHL